MPRCGALSLLQKPLHYRRESAEFAAKLKRKFVCLRDCLPGCLVRRVLPSGTTEPDPKHFSPIWKAIGRGAVTKYFININYALPLLFIGWLSFLSFFTQLGMGITVHKAVISPTHKRTEGRAPVWGSEFTSIDATVQGGSNRNCCWAKFEILGFGDCLVASYLTGMFVL